MKKLLADSFLKACPNETLVELAKDIISMAEGGFMPVDSKLKLLRDMCSQDYSFDRLSLVEHMVKYEVMNRFIKAMKEMHTVTNDDIQQWMSDEQWYTYTYSSLEKKKLQFEILGEKVRVLHGGEIMYEGYFIYKALKFYNEIKTTPVIQ